MALITAGVVSSLVITTSQGGFGRPAKRKNVFVHLNGNAFPDVKNDTLAKNVSLEMQKILHPTTHLTNYTIGPLPERGEVKGSRKKVQCDKLDLLGTRVRANSQGVAPIDLCAVFSKKFSAGSPGLMEVRGVFDFSELAPNAEHRLDVKPDIDRSELDYFASHIESIFEAQNCRLIGVADVGANWQTDWYAVNGIAYAGTSQRQIRNHRRTLTQAEKDVFKRELNKDVSDARKVIDSLDPLTRTIANMTGLLGPIFYDLAKEYGKAAIIAALKNKSLPSKAIVVEIIEDLALGA